MPARQCGLGGDTARKLATLDKYGLMINLFLSFVAVSVQDPRVIADHILPTRVWIFGLVVRVVE